MVAHTSVCELIGKCAGGPWLFALVPFVARAPQAGAHACTLSVTALQPVSQAEAQRLGAVLAAFPTTQAQDQALLAAGLDDAGGRADWQTRRILEFRVERKRALRCGAAPPCRACVAGVVAVGGCWLLDAGLLSALAVVRRGVWHPQCPDA